MQVHFSEIAELFSLKPPQPANPKDPVEKSQAHKFLQLSKFPIVAGSIKAFAREFILQFFEKSKQASLFAGYKHTDYSLLNKVCAALIENSKAKGLDYSLLCQVFLLEVFANHCWLAACLGQMAASYVDLQRDGRAAPQTDLPEQGAKPGEPFQPMKAENLEWVVDWVTLRFKLCPGEGRERDQMLEVTPNMVLPSFSKVELLSRPQREKARLFLGLLDKDLHENRCFTQQARVRKIVKYGEIVDAFRAKLADLSLTKWSDSVYCMSLAGTEPIERDHEDFPIDLERHRGKKATRKNSHNAHSISRPRFNSSSSPTRRRSQTRATTAGSHRKKSDSLIKCSICHNKISGLTWICSKCLHGGHLRHMKKWFAHNSKCPACFDCNCTAVPSN